MLKWFRERRERLGQTRIEEAAQFRKRLREPELDLVERHDDAPASSAFRALYTNADELSKECVTKLIPGRSIDHGLFIAWYEPLDDEALASQWGFDSTLFEFANDGTGNKLAVDPTDEHAEIVAFDHEDGDIRGTGVLLRQWLDLKESAEHD